MGHTSQPQRCDVPPAVSPCDHPLCHYGFSIINRIQLTVVLVVSPRTTRRVDGRWGGDEDVRRKAVFGGEDGRPHGAVC